MTKRFSERSKHCDMPLDVRAQLDTALEALEVAFVKAGCALHWYGISFAAPCAMHPELDGHEAVRTGLSADLDTDEIVEVRERLKEFAQDFNEQCPPA